MDGRVQQRVLGNVADTERAAQHQHGGQPAGMVFIPCFIGSFLYQVSFITGYWCYD